MTIHSLPFIDGFMPIQPFLELAGIFGLLTLAAYWLEQHGFGLNKFFQTIVAFTIVFWYVKYRLYPPLPFTAVVIFLTVAALGIWGWVSSTEAYWIDFCRPIRAVLDGSTALTHAIRTALLVVLPILVGLWAYHLMLPINPSVNGPSDLRAYHPAPPAEITIYPPEAFHH